MRTGQNALRGGRPGDLDTYRYCFFIRLYSVQVKNADRIERSAYQTLEYRQRGQSLKNTRKNCNRPGDRSEK